MKGTSSGPAHAFSATMRDCNHALAIKSSLLSSSPLQLNSVAGKLKIYVTYTAGSYFFMFNPLGCHSAAYREHDKRLQAPSSSHSSP